MSKAFTKEDAPEPDDDGDEDASAGIPAGSKNYITPTGAEKLRAELKQLLTIERPQVVNTVAWAASNGDRSENGDYIYGKRRLREIDRRIRFLGKRLEAAEIVDPAGQPRERVLFGARVTVRDEEGRDRAYRIVGIDEAQPGQGSVSWISPIAKALLNSRPGDVVTFRTPGGEQELEVLRIEY